MTTLRLLAGLAGGLLLAGCVTHHPQTAEEFRRAVPGAFMAMTESYEVNRPWRDVAETLRKRAPECLSVSTRLVSQSSSSFQVIVTDYKPTVVVSAQRAELHIQQHHRSGVMKVTKEPAGGYYLMVIDAQPVAANRTRIDYFGPSKGFEPLRRAIKGWTVGDNLGCPDMTKI